jgi:hypothetical protein
MKTKLVLLTAFLMAPILATAQDDKEFLLDYFEETADNLKDNIQGLDEEQMSYKPSEEDWSVAQCVEHIILTEKMLFDMTKKLLEQPANPERKEEIVSTNQQLIEGITDRSNKFNAPKTLQPTGKYTNPEAAIDDFKAQREQILAYLEKVQVEELRNHISDTPAGPADAYQSFLFLAGHTARHTLQIEEVKGSPGFPD